MRGILVEPSEKQAIIHALRAGISSEQVADDFAVSMGTVKRIRREIGLVERRPAKGMSKAILSQRMAVLAPKLAAIEAMESQAERRGAQLRLAEELRREA